MANYSAFLDESGQREYGKATDNYYVVSGLILREEFVDALSHEFCGLKRAFFRDPGVEIKSNWLRIPGERKKRYCDRYGITENKITAFVEALYNWILATDVVFISGVVDKALMQKQYIKPHNPSALGYQVFLQRFQKFLATRHSEGSIIIDDFTGASIAGNKWRDLLKKQHAKLRQNGCNYTGMKFDNISDSLNFADSQAVPLIQVADIAAYNTFRQFKLYGDQWDDPEVSQLSVYEYFNRLLPRYHQGPSGVFAGFGVVKMPTRTRHQWVV